MRILAIAVLAATAVACSKASLPPPASQGFDVYVPGSDDGGEEGGVDASDAGTLVGQVDRTGRPLVSVLLVPGPLQDEYNAQPSFASTQPRTLQAGIESRLVELDTLGIDGSADPVDWPVTGGATALLPVLVSDTLLVDTARPCTSEAGTFVPSYLDIERELFFPPAPVGDAGPYVHSTCGGRTPNENVVDETLALLVTGDREGGSVASQGIAAATRPATTTFPYLAAPN
jgi:hypothetical protein